MRATELSHGKNEAKLFNPKWNARKRPMVNPVVDTSCALGCSRLISLQIKLRQRHDLLSMVLKKLQTGKIGCGKTEKIQRERERERGEEKVEEYSR